MFQYRVRVSIVGLEGSVGLVLGLYAESPERRWHAEHWAEKQVNK